MEIIREIFKQELKHLINEEQEGKFENHIIFSHPTRAAEYAMNWAKKAYDLNEFYWHVANIISTLDETQDEKIEKIKLLLPYYGWL
jgi:hypothetical protein